MSRMLLHTCCGPCSIYCVDKLKKMNIEFELFWYNPNIHLYKEYQTRRDTLIELYKDTNININILDEYGLVEFCKNVANKENERCKYCYTKRLEETAKYAQENGFDSICTTLFVSPYQNHELIKQIGENICKKYNIKFEYIDFREGFREGQNKAKELGIYMQKYCGCIYSEKDRYQKQIDKDKMKYNK